MSLSLHTIKPAKGSRRKSRRLGRGNATSKGTTAGKGTKGQSARSGGRNKRALRGMRRLMLSTPKLRGFKSLQDKAANVGLGCLEKAFESGTVVNMKLLVKRGMVKSTAKRVKVLGNGNLTKKLVIDGLSVTESAREKITAAGGEIKELVKKKA